ASNTLVSGRAPDEVLRHIVCQVRLAADASWVSVILINEAGHARTLFVDGTAKTFALTNLIRPTGLSMRVMRTAKPVKVEDVAKQRDEVNPKMFVEGVQAALCMPFAVHGKPIGVMWLHYEQPRHFPDFEVDALQLYLNGAAVAYDVSWHLAQLEALRLAVQGLAQATAVQQVLGEIAQSACTILRAGSAAFWSYDRARQQFDVRQSCAVGIAPELWERMRRKEPQRGGTTFSVLKSGWLVVHDIDDGSRYPFLGETTRQFLRQAGAHSFIGLTLRMEQEQLGVLYINFPSLHLLRPEEEEILTTFAHHAALALKKARLLKQISGVRNVAKGVAEMTVLENLDNTLSLVANETRKMLSADAVTLFAYDQEQDRFHYPPTFVGVRYQDRALREAGVLRGSIVEELLRRNEPYLAEEVASDPLFAHRRFAREEGVASVIGVPLHVKDEAVGVMFVNFYSPHHFSPDELVTIRLFASQTAVAIRNAQLYEKLKRRAKDFAALYEAGNVITASFELDEILNRIAEQAASVTGYVDEESSCANIVLADGDLLEFCAAYPRAGLEQVRQRLGGAIDLRTADGGRIGLIGRAFVRGEAQLVNDVRNDPDYLQGFDNIRAELAVPIISGDEIFGVINVEHTLINAFDQGHVQVLKALAAQAAVALQNYRRYETLQRRTQHLQAVYLASQVISTALAANQTELLTRI
ncbi:MAG TPA: GAF domain-containing protein, partial [Caldilineaceae bacterium]|nr:GAF domain-containing protein [Caldilineaceae bacterium]